MLLIHIRYDVALSSWAWTLKVSYRIWNHDANHLAKEQSCWLRSKAFTSNISMKESETFVTVIVAWMLIPYMGCLIQHLL